MTNLWEYYLLSFKIISLVLLKISKAVSNGRVIPIYFAALDTRTTQLYPCIFLSTDSANVVVTSDLPSFLHTSEEGSQL